MHAPLFERLVALAASQPVSFHVPGHKHGRAFGAPSNGGGVAAEAAQRFAALLQLDMTELEGLDDLHQPHGVIAEAEQLAAQCFAAEQTFFLVNGSTAGNLAALMATCQRGDLVLVQRNAHQSILNGLMLLGLRAVFLPVEWDECSGLPLGVKDDVLRAAVGRHPHAKAVCLTNPSYYGAAADLRPLVQIARAAGVLVLVDEAHGAHFGFHSEWPQSAMQCGADLAVQSTHKMLSAMTMSGMLHVQGERIDRGRLRQALRCVQSSSPSYILMASLDLARARIVASGPRDFTALFTRLQEWRQQLAAIPALASFDEQALRTAGYRQDPCKVILHVPGTSGFALQHHLQQYDCWTELADARNVLLALSPANEALDFARITSALHKLSPSTTTKQPAGGIMIAGEIGEPLDFATGPLSLGSLPGKEKVRALPLSAAIGAVSKQALIPYPPGVPLVLPGERVSAAMVSRLMALLNGGVRVRGVERQQDKPYIEAVDDE